jgi:hypothetical protein
VFLRIELFETTEVMKYGTPTYVCGHHDDKWFYGEHYRLELKA